MEQKLSKRGVFIVLDSHQDGYGDRYNGLGFPDYVTFDDGLPFDSEPRFPLNYFQPGTSRAFDNLYANKGGTWRYYGRAWQTMASRFGRDPMLVGYDLMNEPWPGTGFTDCVAAGRMPGPRPRQPSSRSSTRWPARSARSTTGGPCSTSPRSSSTRAP